MYFRIWAEGLIEKEKKHCDEWRGKAIAAQEMSKTADGGGKVAELTQLLKESQLEVIMIPIWLLIITQLFNY